MEKSSFPLTYEQALERILARAAPVGSEIVSLADGWSRIAAAELSAELPDPGYDQSLRDGFVIGKSDTNPDGDSRSFQLRGEIPAGRCHCVTIGPGESYRIMTGGMVPLGADRVVQQEDCCCTGNTVEVSEEVLKLKPRFIQKRGSVIPLASPVILRGTLLGARDIGLLATTGNRCLKVYRRLRVSFFSNGNELVAIGDDTPPGRKISSNRYLLDALLKSCGALPIDRGVAPDNPEKIGKLLSEIKSSKTDIIISTGGMGPGKYDLLERAFEEAGGEIICRAIAMRPGQSTLLGILSGKLYFGLPGPPFAVEVLFHELVLPALRKMQGNLVYLNRDGTALLEQDISPGKNRVFTVREGVLSFRGCSRYVRLPEGRGQANCYMLLEEGKPRYRRGDAVKIHLITR